MFACRGGGDVGGGGVARPTQGDRLGAGGVQPLHARVVGRVQRRRAAAHTNLHGEGEGGGEGEGEGGGEGEGEGEEEGGGHGEGEGSGHAATCICCSARIF